MTITTFLLICLAVALAPILGALLMWAVAGTVVAICSIPMFIGSILALSVIAIQSIFKLVVISPLLFVCDLFIKKAA